MFNVFKKKSDNEIASFVTNLALRRVGPLVKLDTPFEETGRAYERAMLDIVDEDLVVNFYG